MIGLGIIGSRVAAGLRGAGHPVYVWSRSPQSAPNFLGSAVEVVDICDVIQIFVSDDQALLEVIRTIAAALLPRHIVTAHATVSPHAAREAASIVESVGARYLDAPFTGSKAAAQNRQLVYYIGGRAAALEEVRPVLEISSKQIVHLGEVGDASVLKIATNMLTAATVQALSEALAVVRTAGIDGQRLVEAFEHNGSQSVTAALKLPAMLAHNFEPNFSLKHMLKDVRLALGIAGEREVPLPLVETLDAVFSAGMEADWGDEDFCVVTRNYDGLLPEEPVPAAVENVGATEPLDGNDAGKTGLTETVTPEAPPPTDQPSAPAPAANEPLSTPESTAKADLPPIGGDPAGSGPRKNTLRIIRDLFNKPA